MANPFVHVELTTTDTGKAKAFYGALFDWKLDDMEMAPGFTYTMIRVGEGTGGGMMKTPAPGVPTAWLPTSWSTMWRRRPPRRNRLAPLS